MENPRGEKKNVFIAGEHDKNIKRKEVTLRMKNGDLEPW